MPADDLEIRNGTELTPVPIQWLWPGWLASGKVHVMAGPPGAGKTTLAMALCATLTCGGRWPSGETARPRNVVIWSGEDDPTDTLVPRLIACGADMRRVYFVGRVFTGNEKRAFDPGKDMDLLLTKVQAIGDVGMIVVDPLVSAVTGDSHKNSEVRRSLQPLVDLALVVGAAVLGITHFSKSSSGRDPVERVVGSIAFGALARIVMAASKAGEEQGGGRILVRAKSNIGADNGGFRYELRQDELPGYPGITASWAEWGEPLQGEARELLDNAEAATDPEERSALEEAKDFLLSLLANGPVLSTHVKRDCDANGLCWRTVSTAKKSLGIVSSKNNFRDKWEWSLPAYNAKAAPYIAKEDEECRETEREKRCILGGALQSSVVAPFTRRILTALDGCPGGLGRADLTRIVCNEKGASPAMIDAEVNRLLLERRIATVNGRLVLEATP